MRRFAPWALCVLLISVVVLLGYRGVNRARTPDPSLFKALSDPRTDQEGISRLRTCGPRAVPFVPDILKAIGANPRIAPEVMPILDGLAPDWPTRPEAQATAVGLLRNAPDKEIAAAAAFVGRVKPPDVIAKLIHTSLYAQAYRQTAAIAFLDAIDPNWPKSADAVAEIPKLVLALTEPNEDLRREVAKLLDRIDPNWPTSPGARKAVPDLVAQFGKVIFAQRKLVLGVLARIDPNWAALPETRKTLPNLIASLVQVGTNEDAVEELLDLIDPRWPESADIQKIIPVLVAQLRAEQPTRDRLTNAQFLTRLGASGKPAIPGLVRLLADCDAESGKPILGVLGKIDPEWAKSAGAKEARPALLARIAVFVRAKDPDLTPNFSTNALDHVWKPDLRFQFVVGLLDKIDPDWPGAPELTPLVADFTRLIGYTWRGELAVRVLGHIGPPAADAAPALIKLLLPREPLYPHADQNWRLATGTAALAALDRIDPNWPAQPELLRGFIYLRATRDPDVRAYATTALTRIDPKWPASRVAREAMGNLIYVTANDPYANGRTAAAEVLTLIDDKWTASEGAKNAVPKMLDTVATHGTDTALVALELLARIEPKWAETDGGRATIGKLIDRAVENNEAARLSAVDVLAKVDAGWMKSRPARDAVPRLIDRLVNPEEATRMAAGELLTKIDPDWPKSAEAKKAVPRLLKAFDGKDQQVHRATVKVLGQLGPAAKDAENDLISMLASADPDLKPDIRAALKAIQSSK